MPVNHSLNLDPDKYKFTEAETRVLLEDIRKDFRVFGEALALQTQKIDTLVGEVADLKERVTMLEISMSEMKKDVAGMKTDIASIKKQLEGHVTREEYTKLEQRVVDLELKVGHV